MSSRSSKSSGHGGHEGQVQTVHDHDVLSGRGVNIAQHPGNERFRTLVLTRHDESYCSTFSTSEKRALAKEIVDHIKTLDPPGRFLKRHGKTQSNRGLIGPWEELTPKEVLKKTCQALRDCNRNDRTGYAAAVAAPQDVLKNAEERSRTGMTLREQAQAAVARSSSCYDDYLGSLVKKSDAVATPAVPGRGTPQSNNYPTQSRQSPSSMGNEWLKRPNEVGSAPERGVASRSPHGAAVESYMGGLVRALQPPPAVLSSYHHTTPVAPPHMASVPVTNTPMQQPPMYHHLHHPPYSGHSIAPGPLHHPLPIPARHSPAMYYASHAAPSSGHHSPRGEEDSHARIVSLPAPYSPVVWNRRKESEEIDDSAEPVPMADWKDNDEAQDQQNEEAAAAVSALLSKDPGQNDFDLLSGEELSHEDGPLDIDELE